MTVNDLCKSILQQKCPYTKPPFMYIGGHDFCPCVLEAIRQAYIGGYKHGKHGDEPEVGREAVESSLQGKSVDTTTEQPPATGERGSGGKD